MSRCRKKCVYYGNAIVIFMMGMMQLSAKTPSKIKIKKTKMFNKGDKVSVLDEA
jgi:hypothetical protein